MDAMVEQTAEWKVLIHSKTIGERIRAVAADLQQYIDASDREVALAFVTQGGAWFGMKLVDHLSPESYYWGFVGTSSYEGGETGGKVQLHSNRMGDVTGKNVVIVDDIGDRRKTLEYLRDYFLHVEKAHEVRTCVLLNKPSRQECDIPLDFVGLNVVNTFVAGCGLDGGKGLAYTRNYPDVRYKEGTLPEGESRRFWVPETLPA